MASLFAAADRAGKGALIHVHMPPVSEIVSPSR
jgi:hypothetical protein